MNKGSGSKRSLKSFAKSGGTSSRRTSSWGGNSRRSHSMSQSNSRSWFSTRRSEGLGNDPAPTGTWWDGSAPGSDLGGDLGRALGEEFVDGFGHHLGQSDGSAAFWRGVAVCALLVVAILLVLRLGS